MVREREESVGGGKTKKGGAECATLLMASGTPFLKLEDIKLQHG